MYNHSYHCDSTTNLIKKEHFESKSQLGKHTIIILLYCDSTTNLIKKEHFESKSQLL
jgi:hypothetical protein